VILQVKEADFYAGLSQFYGDPAAIFELAGQHRAEIYDRNDVAGIALKANATTSGDDGSSTIRHDLLLLQNREA
jgi:uncharacterized Zn finger protein